MEQVVLGSLSCKLPVPNGSDDEHYSHEDDSGAHDAADGGRIRFGRSRRRRPRTNGREGLLQ